MKEFIKKYIITLICIILTLFVVCITTIPFNNWVGLIWGIVLVAYECFLVWILTVNDNLVKYAENIVNLQKELMNNYLDLQEDYQTLNDSYNKLSEEYYKLEDKISNQE